MYGRSAADGCVFRQVDGTAEECLVCVLLNNEPVIFHKEIYAMACVLGGVVYWGLAELGLQVEFCAVTSFIVTCLIRFLAVRYHISLPVLSEKKSPPASL